MSELADGYTVNVIYKNKDQNQMAEKEYSQLSYCQHTKDMILEVQSDVEDVFRHYEDSYKVGEWSLTAQQAFTTMRRKLQNAANDVSRIPTNLRKDGKNINNTVPSAYFADRIARIEQGRNIES